MGVFFLVGRSVLVRDRKKDKNHKQQQQPLNNNNVYHTTK